MSKAPEELHQAIHRIQILAKKASDDIMPGVYRSAFKGRGIEFEDVRQYIPGDDTNTIDWKVTARFNKPYIKSFREERELTVMLLIDVSSSSYFGTTKKSKNQIMSEIGGLLAFSAAENNDKVGLILFSDTVETYIPPRKGYKHVMKVVRELLNDKSSPKATDISTALKFLNKVQKKTAIVFLISDFISPPYTHQARLTSHHHDLIGIHLHDPAESSLPRVGLINLKDLETGKIITVDTDSKTLQKQLKNHYKNHLNQHQKIFRKIGAGFIKIDCSKSYIDPIRKYFTLRELRK